MDIFSYLLGRNAGRSKVYKFQNKTININTNGSRTIIPDTGYDGLTSVKINVETANTPYAPRYISFNTYSGTDLSTETEELDVSNLSTMAFMFSSCNITSLDLSMWQTNHITSMRTMFSNCRDLETLDLSSFTLNSISKSRPAGLYGMFNNCESLEHLDIRGFVLSDVGDTILDFLNNVPTTCEIIVKNQTEKNWWNTNYPSYTNVKIPE